MNPVKKIQLTYNRAYRLNIDDDSKLVLMSDCHRGAGNWGDNFLKNEYHVYSALTQYYRSNYTYIELGDGDELWENNKMAVIIEAHKDTFLLLSKFYESGRFLMIYGNHDREKGKSDFINHQLNQFYDDKMGEMINLFDGMRVHEGIVLSYRKGSKKPIEILLLHGHQVDCLNDRLWRFTRLLVSYFWKPMELFGANDPTRAAKNYKKRRLVEKRLTQWVKASHKALIAGHTHRPVFPGKKEAAYFNDGSCVHPMSITAIEISEGMVKLVKWSQKTFSDGIILI